MTPSTIAIGAVALVVVIVLVIVGIEVTGGSSSSTGALTAPKPTPASAKVVSEVESVPASVQSAVGAWSAVGVPVASELTSPTVKTGQPPLKLGKSPLPAALYIGGVFCPYCAATRWSLLLAFSKFGTFSGLQETTSSPWDVYPDTPTFDFSKATYSSTYINFQPVELYGQDINAVNTHKQVAKLTSTEASVYQKYDSSSGVPFVDIGNKVLITGAPIYPQLLDGKTQGQVAAQLSNPKSSVTKAIVGTANALIAGICNIDGQKPAAVCSNSGVRAAGSAIGLS